MACFHHHLGMYGVFSSSPGYVWPVFIITRVCIACFHHHLGMYQVFASSPGCLQGARIITWVCINSNYSYYLLLCCWVPGCERRRSLNACEIISQRNYIHMSQSNGHSSPGVMPSRDAGAGPSARGVSAPF